MFKNFFHLIGSLSITFVHETGKITLLFCKAAFSIVQRPFNLKDILRQMEEVGIKSMPVVLITGAFTGAVLALQSYTGFQRFNAETFVGTVVALSITRELGPVLTGLMVSGRVGSSMAAELGTMQVTEQIDALYTLAVNPIKYLIVPRLLAALIMMPVLVIFADLIGIAGGYFVSVKILSSNPYTYMERTWNYLELNDIFSGLFKAAVFGVIIATISCYQGFYTRGGAEGVGRATTKAVVLSCLLILIFNYIITALLF